MKKKAVVWVGGHASDAMRRPLSPAGRGGPVAGTSFFFFFLGWWPGPATPASVAAKRNTGGHWPLVTGRTSVDWPKGLGHLAQFTTRIWASLAV